MEKRTHMQFTLVQMAADIQKDAKLIIRRTNGSHPLVLVIAAGICAIPNRTIRLYLILSLITQHQLFRNDLQLSPKSCSHLHSF